MSWRRSEEVARPNMHANNQIQGMRSQSHRGKAGAIAYFLLSRKVPTPTGKTKRPGLFGPGLGNRNAHLTLSDLLPVLLHDRFHLFF
jgi:hypothetical protein